MTKNTNKFELLYEQNCKLDSKELTILKGGQIVPQKCCTIYVGIVVCAGIIIGED